MRCPALHDLPTPEASRTGWPFTENDVAQHVEAGLPRISIVIPSFNQGRYLEEAIRSVLLQGYPDLELIVMDGGSSDETVAVLRKYESWLTHWQSAPDSGQSHAINEGFRRATGELYGWIGCDDRLLPGALVRAGRHFAEQPRCHWFAGSGQLVFPAAGRVGVMASRVESLDALQSFWRFGSAECFVVQPSCFWRRWLWDAVGGVRADLHLAMDYELWLRFAERAELHRCDDVFSLALRAAGGKTFDQQPSQVQERMRCAYQFAASRGRMGRTLTVDFLHWYALERLRWGRHHALRGEYAAAMVELRRLLESPLRVLAESGRLAMLQH